MSKIINVSNKDGKLVVSSREVAENFGKRHSDVLEKIHVLIAQVNSTENSVQYFILSRYVDSSGKANKEYLLTRDGFSLLVMGFTGQKALDWKLKYITAFNEMENALKENIQIDEFHRSENKAKEIEAKHNNSLVRKARLLEKIANDPSTPKEYKQVLHSKAVEIVTGQELLPLPEVEKMYTAGEIAKELGISANKVGRIANKHKLKTPLYGKLFMDKSKHSPKQVQSWRYTEAGKEQVIEIYKDYYDV